jgi:hypothetical protein
MEKFIEEQNVTPFSERFKTENDPRTRKLLTRLLPDAENKLAATPIGSTKQRSTSPIAKRALRGNTA